MVRFLCVWQFGLALARLSGQQTTPAEIKAKLEVEDLEKRWLAAANDPESLQVILGDDFVFVSPTGPLGKEQWIARVKQHRADELNETRRFNDLQVRVYGETAVVNGTVVRTNLRHGNSTSQDAFTDIFIRRDGRWQAVNSQQTPMNSSRRK